MHESCPTFSHLTTCSPASVYVYAANVRTLTSAPADHVPPACSSPQRSVETTFGVLSLVWRLSVCFDVSIRGRERSMASCRMRCLLAFRAAPWSVPLEISTACSLRVPHTVAPPASRQPPRMEPASPARISNRGPRPADFVASSLSFCAAAVAIHRELDLFLPSATWLVRMPLVATFAAEVAKLRGVLVHTQQHTQNYFFWLFVTQAVLEGAVALWACTIACPPKSMLDTSQELHSAYEVRLLAPPLPPLALTSSVSMPVTNLPGFVFHAMPTCRTRKFPEV